LDKKQQNGCQNIEKNLEKDVLDINTIIKNSDVSINSNVKVSFMVFRTGSVLIVGKCDENVLLIICVMLEILNILNFFYFFNTMSLLKIKSF
jgi:citrate lyase synthetase